MLTKTTNKVCLDVGREKVVEANKKGKESGEIEKWVEN